MTDPERSRRVQALFLQALECPTAERPSFLAQACGDDEPLRHDVESLIRGNTGADRFLDSEDRGHVLEAFVDDTERALEGRTLGSYRLEARLGSGGMGVVYRAVDTRLRRQVAVKVLRGWAGGRPDQRARFDREARAAAALNHPHVVAVFDVGEQDGLPFVVTELLEGRTVRDLLSEGPVAPPAATVLAQQAAAGLAAAHDRGVVHRDIKPENLFVTTGGALKILDFGIAKLSEPVSEARCDTTLRTEPQAILGTLAYMAPEQVRGEPADARADIFGLGAVLFEMLTGRPAFARHSMEATVAAILGDDPAADAGPLGSAPALLRDVVRKCLCKRPADRYQTADDVRLALEAATRGLAPTAEGPVRRERRIRPWVVVTLAAAAVAVVGTVAGLRSPNEAARAPALRMALTMPDGMLPGLGASLSPDGQLLAMAATDTSGNTRLWVRSLTEGTARPLEGTDGAAFPFWSPDGRRLGFFAGGKLKTVAVQGSSPQILCDAPNGRGGTWAGNTIVFTPTAVTGALSRVDAGGGDCRPASVLDVASGEDSHRFPEFLPGGREFVYYATGPSGYGRGLAYIGSLDDPRLKVRLLETSVAVGVAAPDHLLFVRDGTLWAQRFDAAGRRRVGEPWAVAADVQTARIFGYQNFSASRTGTIIYQPHQTLDADLVWRSRDGRVNVVGDRAEYLEMTLAPDDRSVAVTVRDSQTRRLTLRVLDLARDVFTVIGFPDADNGGATWSPDGRRLAFSSNRTSPGDVYVADAHGSGVPELLFPIGRPDSGPRAWTPDGRFVLFTRNDPRVASTLWARPLSPAGAPVLLVGTGNVYDPAISPDGRWVAYTVEDAGRREVFVQRFPEATERRRVSPAGGTRPRWSRDGSTVFYVAADRMLMSATLESRAGRLGAPEALFETYPTDAGGSPLLYDVAGDGRFLLVRPRAGARVAQTAVILNWPSLAGPVESR